MKQKDTIKKRGFLILYSIIILSLFCGNLYARDKKQETEQDKLAPSKAESQNKGRTCSGSEGETEQDKLAPSKAESQNKGRTCSGSEGETVSLKEAITKALALPEIKTAKSALKAANFDIIAAKSKRLPSIDIYSDVGHQATDNFNSKLYHDSGGRVSDIRNSFEIKLTQPLFDGYKAKYNINVQNKRAEAFKYELIKTEEQTALNAVRAYTSLYFANQMYSIATMTLAKYYDMLSILRNLYKTNKIEESYFFEIQEMYDSMLEQEAAFLSECRKADLTYLLAVGTMPPASFELEEPQDPKLCPKTQQGMHNLLLGRNPLLLAGKAYEKAAAENVKAVDASFMPNIDLEFSKTWLKNVDGSRINEDSELALITLNYNLFNGGEDVALKKKAKELKKKARYEKESLISLMENKAKNFFIDMLDLSRTIQTLTTLKETQAKLIKSYRKDKYIDIMKTTQRFFKTNIKLLTAQRDYLITRHELLAEGGLLLKSFNLK